MKTNTTRLMTGYATLILCSVMAVGADTPAGARKARAPHVREAFPK